MEQDTVSEFTGIFTQECSALCLRWLLLQFRGHKKLAGHWECSLHITLFPACPSINPAISELYKQNRKKPLLCKTEEQTFYTGRNNQEFPFPFLVTGRTKQEWKFLNEEKKAKFFPSKFPQKSPDTYQLMTRYCFFKLAIISSPNFNEFVSSWKRMCQFRG